MPIPKPNPGEKESDFVGRCISALKKADPERDDKQIQAMCYGSWREAKKLSEPETYDINDKELVAVGTWNTMDGKLNITEKDIDAIMESYNEINKTGIRKIPIKLGHDDDQKLLQKDGYPTAGWVENLRKKSVDNVLKIVGDLKAIPNKVHTIIQNKGFVNVSPELSRNFTYLNTGKKYKWLFNRLALLGIDQPAQDLDELVKAYAKEGSGTATIDFRMSEPMVTDELPKTKPQLKEGIMPDELKEKYESDIKGLQEKIKELQTKDKEQEVKTKEQEDEKVKLQKSLTEAEEKLTAVEEEKKKTEIVALIDGAIKEGKILPVQKEGYVQTLSAMPEKETYKFSDNGEEKEGSALELFKSIMSNMPNLVELSEFTEQKAKIPTKNTEDDGTKMDDVELAEKVNKVMVEEKVDQDEAYDRLKERGEVK